MTKTSESKHPRVVLGLGHTTAKTTTTVIVTFTATAKNTVNRSHTKLSFLYNGVQFVANFLLIVHFRPVQLLRDVHFCRSVTGALTVVCCPSICKRYQFNATMVLYNITAHTAPVCTTTCTYRHNVQRGVREGNNSEGRQRPTCSCQFSRLHAGLKEPWQEGRRDINTHLHLLWLAPFTTRTLTVCPSVVC